MTAVTDLPNFLFSSRLPEVVGKRPTGALKQIWPVKSASGHFWSHESREGPITTEIKGPFFLLSQMAWRLAAAALQQMA